MNAIHLVALIVLFIGLSLIESSNARSMKRKGAATGSGGRDAQEPGTPVVKARTEAAGGAGSQGQTGNVARSTTVAP